MFNGFPSSSNVLLVTSGETTDDRNIPIFVDGVSDLTGNHFDGFEIIFRGGGESSLNDVYSKLGKLASNVELLFRSHGGAGGLFAVAEGGVEDADIRGVRDVVGDVRRTVARGRGLGLRLGGGGGARYGEIGKRVAWFRGMREMDAELDLIVGRGKTCGGGREKGSSNSGGHGS
ncbi:hypothetical protein TSUD_00480 [Trifolium subterraneum]|nr:hypothetical protein TSUD_00480 [Trifolium subterraneum]